MELQHSIRGRGRDAVGVWMEIRGLGILLANSIHPDGACQAPQTSAGVVPEMGLH